MATSEPPPKAPDIDFDAFTSLDMRVGRVVEVEDFPEARKPSLKLTVDFGPLGLLRTSAQIAHLTREELVGWLVVGAVNLGSKRVAGFKSEFLVLGAADDEGRVQLLKADASVQPGARVF